MAEAQEESGDPPVSGNKAGASVTGKPANHLFLGPLPWRIPWRIKKSQTGSKKAHSCGTSSLEKYYNSRLLLRRSGLAQPWALPLIRAEDMHTRASPHQHSESAALPVSTSQRDSQPLRPGTIFHTLFSLSEQQELHHHMWNEWLNSRRC